MLFLGMVLLASCSNRQADVPAAYGDNATLHYREGEIKAGDLIPFYWDGAYHVFYLQNNDWAHIVSDDLLSWRKLPDALVKGSDPLGPDSEGIWTGSLVEHDGTFYLFYTGKNYNDPLGDQKVMRATSSDLVNWTKDSTFIFYADGEIYWNKSVNGPIDDRHAYHHQAFRDPHVVWNEQADEWWMGFHGMLSDGSKPVVTLYTSKDLDHWTPQQPWVIYPASVSGDCPDIFQERGKWYIDLADYHYVQVDEPGAVDPPVMQYDCGDLRVAKTMYDGQRRIIMGWVGDYAGNTDSGEYQWGGDMSMPREIYAGDDGRLYQRPVKEAVDFFRTPVVGKRRLSPGEYVGGLPGDYMLHATLDAGAGSPKAMLLFRQEEGGTEQQSYRLTIDYATGEIAIGSPHREYKWACGFDGSKPVDVRLFVEGTIAECFVNDMYCFTMRVYDFKGQGVSFTSTDDGLRIKDFSVYGK